MVVCDFVEAGTSFAGMEEVENRHMGYSENSEAHSGIEVKARSETEGDRSEIDSVVLPGKETVHSGIAEVHSGREEDRSGTEEAVRFEIEVGSRARLAGEIVAAVQTLDSEVEQNSAAAG